MLRSSAILPLALVPVLLLVPVPSADLSARAALSKSAAAHDRIGFADKKDRPEKAPDVEVRFLDEKDEGWSIAETTNFRIFHKHGKDLIEKVARVAEMSRTNAYAKWLGAADEAWNPKCFIYVDNAEGGNTKSLHGVRGYAKRGGLGWSTRRYIRVRAKDAGLLDSVLPHEITHAVMFGEFVESDAPPWAHEGMAGLAQSKSDLDQYKETVLNAYRTRGLFYVGKVIDLDEYPADDVGVYYAESVSLVEFLVHEKGERGFIRFLRDAVRTGTEAALKKHYGFADFRDLEKRWKAYTFGDGQRPPQGFARLTEQVKERPA